MSLVAILTFSIRDDQRKLNEKNCTQKLKKKHKIPIKSQIYR